MQKRSRMPSDPNQLAHALGQMATGASEPQKNPAAVALGRLGGLKGGAARARALSKTQRAQIARKAAQARWRAKK